MTSRPHSITSSASAMVWNSQGVASMTALGQQRTSCCSGDAECL